MIRDNYEGTTEYWKREFLDLYMSADVEKYGQALELKRLHVPKKIISLSDIKR